MSDIGPEIKLSAVIHLLVEGLNDFNNWLVILGVE